MAKWYGVKIKLHYFITFLELAGTVAFAASGAMTAMKINMDVFGVIILGLVTAVGGGIIRDITLGITPPATFRNPVYALAATITAVIVFIPWTQRLFRRYQRVYDYALLAMDSVGLGIFTVIGVEAALSYSENCGVFLLCFVGVVTGVGGGIIRDLLAGDMPYVLHKHVYACASLAGALVCIWIWPLSHACAMAAGSLAVIFIRGLSAHFRWSLPKAHME